MIDIISLFPWVWIIFCAVMGSFFGSFASVVLYRTAHNQSGIFLGRSRCCHTGKPLKAFELIPVFSWLYQAGRSAKSGQSISPWYVCLELGFGLAYGLLSLVMTQFVTQPNFWLLFVSVVFALFFVLIMIFYGLMFRKISTKFCCLFVVFLLGTIGCLSF